MNFYQYYIESGVSNVKHDCHNYIERYYSPLFESFDRSKSYNILEIGVRNGSSLKMWSDWFINSKIYGIDIDFYMPLSSNIIFFKEDAYTEKMLNKFEDNLFDIIIDDGPHTVPSQIFTIEKYINKIKPNGKLIIEDIGCKDDNNNPYSPETSLNMLIESIDKKITDYKVFDLRNKGQYDSIILEITKK